MYKYLISLILFIHLFTGCSEPNAPVKSAVNPAPPPPQKPLPIEQITSRVADRLPTVHLNRCEFNDAISAEALNLFIDSLDYDHTFFLASDIEEFQREAKLLDDQVLAGDISFAQTVLDRFKERVTDRVAYANKLLDQGFDMNISETYHWKRDEAPWAVDQAAWDDLWRKKVKNDYVARVAAIEAGADDDSSTGTNAVKKASTAKVLTPVEHVRERYKQYQLLIDTNLDSEALLQRYLSAFTHSYDPHSDYLSPRSVEDFDINMSLSLVGIGATLRSEDGAAKIENLIPGSPAEQDGRLQAGDKIIAVAQGDQAPVSILYWPLSKAVRIIRGEKGTQVVLTVIPAEDATGTRTKTVDLIRDEVKLEAQAAKGELRTLTNGTLSNLAIITLPEFYADFEATRNGDETARRASTDVRKLLTQFSTNKLDGVVLDLRNNGGGSLVEAIDIAGLFISVGAVVQVREQFGVSVLRDDNSEILYNGPLVVLVNRLSASASEIVAAALQDYGRAIIVGDSKTHGKGTVQTVVPLSKQSDELGSLKITTASFYRIAGGSTQLKGVIPDVILPSLYDSLELGEEYLPHALPWSQVRPTYYRPWSTSVKPAIVTLQKQSDARMTNNPALATFMSRRDQIRKQMETKEVSLKLADRVNDIVSEKAIEKLQDEELGEHKKDKEDPILDETLNILSDWIQLSGRKSDARIAQSESK
ncbi:MAG: tail-specific protease [Kiritimatiellaceae bacterium]|nr:tail-specific protease [Kiritimatiellaceae bacterium]